MGPQMTFSAVGHKISHKATTSKYLSATHTLRRQNIQASSLSLPRTPYPSPYISNPIPFPIFSASHLFLNASLLSSLVFRAQTSILILPLTKPSCSAQTLASIPLSSHTTSYSCLPTTVGAVSISSTLGISPFAARDCAAAIAALELWSADWRIEMLDCKVVESCVSESNSAVKVCVAAERASC